MIRHPTILTKIRFVATAAKPRVPNTTPYLYEWTPRPEPPLRTPTAKVWSRPQQPTPLTDTPVENPSTIRAAPPPESLKKWARPIALPSNSKISEISVLNSDTQPSIVPPAAPAAHPPEAQKKWSRVALPSNTKLSEIYVLNSDSQPSIAVSQPTPLSPDSDYANSPPTLAETPAENPHRSIGVAPPFESLKKWSRPPVIPRSDSILSQTNSHSLPSMAPPAAQKVSHPTSLSADSDHANSSHTLAETAAEHPSRAIGAAPPPETLKKWSRPVPRSDSILSQTNPHSLPLMVPLAAQKVSHPTSLSPDSDHANSSHTLAETAAEHPSRAIGAAPPPETLKKWSRPVPRSDSILSQTNPHSLPLMVPLAAQKVSHPTSLSPDSDHANSSHTLAETAAEHPSRAIGAAPPPETLKKWSRPVPRSDSILSQTNPHSLPLMVPLAAQKVSHPTSLSPDSDHANSSHTMTETPAEHRSGAIGAAPPPESLKKWSRPVAARSDSILSQTNPHSLPSMAPPAAQKVSHPTSFSADSDHANSSHILAKIPAEHRSGAIGAAPPPEALKKWSRPVALPPNSKLSEISLLNLDSQSITPRVARELSPRKRSASQPTSLSPVSVHANQALAKSQSPTPPRQEFTSSLDTDPDDELVNKRLRQEAYRRNQKGYFEGKGRFERVPSKVLVQQSANTPLFKKKGIPLPKLIKARRMDVFIPSTLSVAALAILLNVKLARLQQKMKRADMESESSYDHILTSDYAVLLAEEFGRNPIVDDEAAFDIHPPVAHPNPSSLPSRPPIVTIMGHVDHGKTTLLDTLRSASVAKGEAGGITQHIGAFSVPVNEMGSGPKSITFLDTPGHAAFSAMRARGANVTDIIVLVVAADDGIMPQTKEVINLFKRDDSQVGLVVAINKVDKPNVDLDSVKRALMAEGIQVEDFGGNIPAVNVSGLTGEGLPELLETLSLVAEMQDLRAEHTGSVYGHVLESNVQKGLGPVATILIRRGCLKAGTHVLSGLSHAKVRRMNDSNGKVVKVAIPGMAVTVSGWKILPKAGDIVLDGSENDIKKAMSNRARRQELEALHQDVDAINSRRQRHRDLRSSGEDEAPLAPVSCGPLELKLIIKADVSGSAEAVRDALHDIGNDVARAQVISTGVGEISESDVMMAKAANATIVGFSVTASRSVQNNATQNDIPVCTSDIIYRLVDDVRERVTALLPVIVETRVTGEATILQLFDIDLKQKQTLKIAGCRVTNGVIEKQRFARVLRNGNIVYDGTLSTMRHIKKDITEARKGTECGLGFSEFRDLEAGDLVQMYEKIEKPGVI